MKRDTVMYVRGIYVLSEGSTSRKTNEELCGVGDCGILCNRFTTRGPHNGSCGAQCLL